MSIPFYSSLNMNGNTIENAEGLEGGSSVYLEKPESPVKGDIYFNSSEGKLEIYSGYNWVVYDSNAITTTTDYSGSISTTDCYAVSPGVATFAGSKFYIKFHRAPKSTTGTVGLAVGSLGQISFVNPDGSSVQCSQIKSGMVVQFYLVSLKTAKLITPIPTNVTVEDNLTSTSATNALSANQGKILNETIEANNKVIFKSAFGFQLGYSSYTGLTTKDQLDGIVDCDNSSLYLNYTDTIISYGFYFDIPESLIDKQYIYLLSDIPFTNYNCYNYYTEQGMITMHNRKDTETLFLHKCEVEIMDDTFVLRVDITNLGAEANYRFTGNHTYLYNKTN